MPPPLEFSRTRQTSVVLGVNTYTPSHGTTWYTCTPPAVNPSELVAIRTLSKSISDCPTPGFKGRVARGEIVGTRPVLNSKITSYDNYHATRYWSTVPYQCCNDQWTRVEVIREYVTEWAPTPSPITISSFDSQLPHMLKRATADCRKAELDLLTTWGERKETISHIAGRLKDVGRLTSRFRDQIRRMRSKESIHGAWLEYRYAIMPNVYTVQSMLKILNSENYTHAKGHDSLLGTETSSYFSGSGDCIEVDVVTEWKVRAYALAVAAIKALGFHYQINPLVTLWELTWLSFVLDWFIDVGDTLASYQMPWESRIADTGASVQWKHTCTPRARNFDSPYTDSGGTCNGVSKDPYSRPYYSRTVLVASEPYIEDVYCRFPLPPSSAAKLPTINVKLNNIRLMDAVALLRGSLRR